MSEQKIQATILKYLLAKGAYAIKIVTASKAGVLDIACCYKGKFIAIEVKFGNNTPSALQLVNIYKVQEAGGIAFVAYDLKTVAGCIDSISP